MYINGALYHSNQLLSTLGANESKPGFRLGGLLECPSGPPPSVRLVKLTIKNTALGCLDGSVG